MKHEVNAMGKQCPIPVVMTKKVIDNAAVGDEIEILIDNETAVNNLSRLANKTGCTFVSEKLGDKKYQVKMAVKTEQTGGTLEEEEFVCEAPHKKVTVAVISSNVMGNGDDELGKILIKGIVDAVFTILEFSGVRKWESQIIRTGFLPFSSLHVSIGSSASTVPTPAIIPVYFNLCFCTCILAASPVTHLDAPV